MTDPNDPQERIQKARSRLYGRKLAGDPLAVADLYRERGADMEVVLCAIGVIFAAEEGEIEDDEETADLIDRLVERAKASQKTKR